MDYDVNERYLYCGTFAGVVVVVGGGGGGGGPKSDHAGVDVGKSNKSWKLFFPFWS